MTHEIHKAKTIKAIKMLVKFNSFDLKGKRFELVSHSDCYANFKGGKGADYTIGVSPKMKVIQDSECPVFFILRGGRKMGYFTISNDEIVLLYS